MIKWTCTECGSSLRADQKRSGSKAKCPKCGGIVLVPGRGGPEEGAAGSSDLLGELAGSIDGHLLSEAITHDQRDADRGRSCGVCQAPVGADDARCPVCGALLQPRDAPKDAPVRSAPAPARARGRLRSSARLVLWLRRSASGATTLFGAALVLLAHFTVAL